MVINKELSNKIANVGFVCACLVVARHISYSDIIVDKFLQRFVAQGVAVAAVPMFFLISGFLLARHMGETFWYKNALIKRFKTLFVPFVIFNVLLYVLELFVGVLTGEITCITDVVEFRIILAKCGLIPWLVPANSPLWFVRCLMYLVILSPLLLWICKDVRRFAIAIVVFALIHAYQGTLDGAAYPHLSYLFDYDLNFRCPLYFMIGIYLSFANFATEKILNLSKKKVCIIVAFCGVIYVGGGVVCYLPILSLFVNV